MTNAIFANENRLSTGDDSRDRALVERAVEGSKDALRELVQRHQPFIFNLALKMFGARADAEDLTQEVLVKVITSLRTFRHGSSLRTWLYRITVHHFLNTRRRLRESTVAFEDYFDQVAAIPDEEPDASLGIGDATIEELRLRCTSGMLMCLDREQRIAFILGAVFGVPHEIGAELLDITPGNFAVRLHRARRDLYNWMNKRC
ncbi:MAG TPA: RNA polymerase sigma factor, partial [Kofleriaceae bacterium]